MVRAQSVAVAVLAITLPVVSTSYAQTPPQEPPVGQHTVSRGETLWALAARYLGNPFSWPRIHELNRTLVPDPHWIFPGQLLQIPGATGAVTGVRPIPAEGMPADPRPVQAPMTGPAGRGGLPPTVFLQEERVLQGTVVGRGDTPYPAVPLDAFLSAGWIDPLEEGASLRHEGRITGFEGVAARSSLRRTADLHSSVRVTVTGPRTPVPGELLLTFRPGDEVPGHGRIARPTGILRVERIDVEGVVARVERIFDRVLLEDLVLPAPAYDLRDGVHPSPIQGGMTARILAFARPHELQILGDIAFLDVGSDRGVSVGDEFVVVVAREGGWSGTEAGRLQVVGVRPGTAAARIMAQDGAIFRAGIPVRLDRRMP